MTTPDIFKRALASRRRVVGLIIVVVLAFVVANLARQFMIATGQGRAAQIALTKGASVEYDFYFENGDPDGLRLPGATPPAPAFLHQNVVGLMTSGPRWVDADLALLRDMPYLVKLMLNSNPNIGDAGLAHVGDCSGLRSLALLGLPRVTDAGVAQLGRIQKRRLNLTVAALIAAFRTAGSSSSASKPF